MSMRPAISRSFVAFAAAAAAGLAGCLPAFPERPPMSAPVQDTFDDADLAGRYRVVGGGSWRVVDGALSTLGDHNIPLWRLEVLPDNVRVSFTSRSASPDVDMKVEIFGDGVRHESGYIAILGGWKNTLSTIARLDEHEKNRVTRRTRFEANRTYRWTIQRTDGHTVELFVDGERLLAYDDPEPLVGPRHRAFAFSGWESPVVFDDLTITPLP